MTPISILIPHYKTPKITAYSVAQFLKHKGKHEIQIIVINNSYGDDSILSLKPFEGQIKIVDHISDKLSSHGIALDSVVPIVETEYFITAESDSFPMDSNWLDYYENLIQDEVDLAGSLLQLSGGSYIHPAGALYKKSNWLEAKKYCEDTSYAYFPNMAMKNDFACHLMVHSRILPEFLEQPEKYIVLSSAYQPYEKEKALQQLHHYSPVVAPFHNGMGGLQEDVKTYGQRDIHSDSPKIILDGKDNFIYRVGYEPGQWLSYWHLAVGKRVVAIPTQVIWMQNRQYQQQERTIMENSFCHLWGCSSFYRHTDKTMQDVIDRKKQVVDSLYDSLPTEQKITPPVESGVLTD